MISLAMMVEVSVLIGPGGEWHATAAPFAFGTISLEMVLTATTVALQWLSVFALWVASASKAFS